MNATAQDLTMRLQSETALKICNDHQQVGAVRNPKTPWVRTACSYKKCT